MLPSRPNDRTPPGTGLFGLKLFLASLSVLFAASLLGYIIIRMRAVGLNFGTLRLPASLWLSTAIMMAGSLFIHKALRAVRENRLGTFRKSMVVTACLGLSFLAVQAPSLFVLLEKHAAYRQQHIFLYGLILLLIALHAIHVLGGLIPLGVVTGGALRRRYDAQHFEAVQSCALYWHFLDVVWLVMFGLLFFLG